MTRTKGHIPVRTCIACGAKRPKCDLLRLVLSDSGEIRLDTGMNRGGRGAYLCDRPECRSKIGRHRALNRLFRTDRPVRLAEDLMDET